MYYLFYEQYMNNIMHISGEKEQYGVSHRNKKASIRRPFYFMKRVENRDGQLFLSHQLRSGPRYHQSV